MNLLLGAGVIIVAGVVGILLASLSWLFWDVWKAADLDTFRAVIGAFTGAFFAYLFVRFGDAMKRIYYRKEINYDELVKLQYFFNNCLNINSDNIFTINNCINSLSDTNLTSEKKAIFITTFQEYPVDIDSYKNLTNLDFINELYSLIINLNKINHSISSMERMYSLMLQARLNQTLDNESYIQGAIKFRSECEMILGFLIQLNTKLKKLYAIDRLLLSDAPSLAAIFLPFLRSTYSKDFSVRLPLELIRLEKELEDSKKTSRDEILEATKIYPNSKI